MISRYLILSKIPVNKTSLCTEIETLIGSLVKYADYLEILGLSVSGNGLNLRFLSCSIDIWSFKVYVFDFQRFKPGTQKFWIWVPFPVPLFKMSPRYRPLGGIGRVGGQAYFFRLVGLPTKYTFNCGTNMFKHQGD